MVWILMIVRWGPVARADWRTWENRQNALVYLSIHEWRVYPSAVHWRSVQIYFVQRVPPATVPLCSLMQLDEKLGISPPFASVCGTKTIFKGAPAIQNWSPGPRDRDCHTNHTTYVPFRWDRENHSHSASASGVHIHYESHKDSSSNIYTQFAVAAVAHICERWSHFLSSTQALRI